MQLQYFDPRPPVTSASNATSTGDVIGAGSPTLAAIGTAHGFITIPGTDPADTAITTLNSTSTTTVTSYITVPPRLPGARAVPPTILYDTDLYY